MSDTATYAEGQVYEVDPATLTIGTNVRADVRESSDFAASIKARGVLEPITAWADEDGSLVVYRGQRRTLTACKVGTPTGTVPVSVVARPDEADRITDQLTENVHREQMSTAEEVAAIEQLALLGVSAAQITKRTALGRSTVDAALTVAASSTAKDKMSEGLTLAQAAAVAEFQDDPRALEQLERTISYGHSLDHAVQRLRDERAEREMIQAEAERLRAEGLPALDVSDYPRNTYGLRLADLVRIEDGQPVPEEQWPEVPGAAVVVERRWEWVATDDEDQDDEGGAVEATDQDDDSVDLDEWAADEDEDREQVQVLCSVWVCLDPEAAGLIERWKRNTGSGQSAGEADDESTREAKRAERRRVVENNKAWRSAETVRREWLAGFLTRKTPPKGAETLITTILLSGPHWLRQAMENGHSLLRHLSTGKEPSPLYAGGTQELADLATTPKTPKAHTMRTLAAIVAAWEDSTSVQTWRGPSPDDGLILAYLIEAGYEPSEVERLLLDQDRAEEDAA